MGWATKYCPICLEVHIVHHSYSWSNPTLGGYAIVLFMQNPNCTIYNRAILQPPCIYLVNIWQYSYDYHDYYLWILLLAHIIITVIASNNALFVLFLLIWLNRGTWFDPPLSLLTLLLTKYIMTRIIIISP